MEEHSLAYELLEEVKRGNDKLEKSNKRWFIISIIELIIIVFMVLGFLVYLGQYDFSTEETYTQESLSNKESDIIQTIN